MRSVAFILLLGPTADRLLQLRMNIMSPSACNQSLLNVNPYEASVYVNKVICVGTQPTEGNGQCHVSSILLQ
jgi:hypothetical protein